MRINTRSRDYRLGRECGWSWARTIGYRDPKHEAALQRLETRDTTDFASIAEVTRDMFPGIDAAEIKTFWDCVRTNGFYQRLPSRPFVRGFLDGALDLAIMTPHLILDRPYWR